MQEFESKESSNVHWARYDADTEILEVDFKTGKGNSVAKSTYEYKKFPIAAWEAFQKAESKGRHFAAAIRPYYRGVKIRAPGASTLPLE